MPLTPAQINAADQLIRGYTVEVEVQHEGLDDLVTDLIRARDDVQALVRIHTDIADANASTVLAKAKARAKVAADALSVLLA